VKVTFVTPGDKKTKGDKKWTEALAIPEGLTQAVRLTLWGEHTDEWTAGSSKQLKLKEKDAYQNIRQFMVLTGKGGGGRGWGGAPARPTWDMSSGDAAKFSLAIWKNQYDGIKASAPDLAPDTAAMAAAELTKVLLTAANIAITKPGAAKTEAPPPSDDREPGEEG
jgi:hypothetical protein